MGVGMAGKVRHFKERNGRYSARLVVPQALRPYLDGKAELEIQLGGEKREALRNHAAAVASIQKQIGIARQKHEAATGQRNNRTPYPLTAQQIALRDYQSQIDFDAELRAQDSRYARFDPDPDEARRFRDGFAGKLSDDELAALVGARIERARLAGNTSATKGTDEWRALAQALCVAAYEAMQREDERNEGDFNGKPTHPLLENATPAPDPAQAISVTELLEEYLKGLERDGKGREARKRWTPVFKDLVKFVGHDDAARMTDDDIMTWRNKKLETLSTKTVSDVYMASVRAVLKWAVSEKKLPHNPAGDVRVKKKKPIKLREKGFRDDEALAVLKFCRTYQPKEAANPSNREAPKSTAAKRWASILCAFTGARIVEMMQLRKEDVRKEGETIVIRITPDAGSVKTGQYRDVPLHKQIIDEGFLKFVEASKAGPLFHNNKPDEALTGARTMAGRISNWLRDSEIIPDGVQPNHAWRHRFKTVGREVGVSDRILDSIQGHAARTAGDDYGDVTIIAKKKAIDQFPRYALVAKAAD